MARMIGSIRARAAHVCGDRGPKLARDLVSLATGQFASMLIGFAAFAYLARVLDPVAYGAVEYAIAVAALAAIVIECGAGTIGVRELVRQPDRARDLASAVPVGRLMLALVVIPIAGLSSRLAGQEPEVTALVWLYAFSLLAVPFKQDWLLQGFERMSQASFAQPIRTGVFAIGVFLFVREAGDAMTVGAIEIASIAAVSVYFLIAQHLWTVPFGPVRSIRLPLILLKEGAAVGLSNGLWAFMLYAPMIMVTSLVGASEGAWLGAAQRLVISLVTFSFVYHFNLYPVIARTITHDPAAWGRVTAASCRLVAWAGIGFSLAVTLLSVEIMTLGFGPAFAEGAAALSILIWIFPLRTLTGHARWSLIATGHQRYLLGAEVLGAVTLLGIGAFAIPMFGAAGAAASLAGGILASGVVTQFAINRLVGPLSLLRPALLPIGAALAGLGISTLIEAPALPRAVTGIAIFTAVALTQTRTGLAALQTVAYAKAQKE
jgi:O-antigen/teichoic acid export membrane protein